MVDLVGINYNDPNSTKYSINLLQINTKVVTKYLLNPINATDIASVPISVAYYMN